MLGETPWKINKPVLEVVEKLWAAGGGIADLVEASDVSFCCCYSIYFAFLVTNGQVPSF